MMTGNSSAGGCQRNALPLDRPRHPMRSVRPTAGTPSTASKNRTTPSKVWAWSMEEANHQHLMRLQHSTAPKHCSSWSQPHRRAQWLQSDQSNWNSSPGPVSIGTVTTDAFEREGPRRSRKWRVRLG